MIPLLDPEVGAGDPVALATWHEALSSAVGVDVPHDLFALWLYPAAGGSVLVGPAALAEDRLAIPLPAPHIRQDQLYQLEERVREAGYASAVSLPVPFGQTDVGLMLLASLRPGEYGPQQGIVLHEVARRLGPTLARIGRRWGRAERPDANETEPAELVDAVAAAIAGAATPREFARAVFAALQPLVPHDRAELLVPGGPGDQWYRFGEHTAGALWSDPALVIAREDVDVERLFEGGDLLVTEDTRRDRRWAGWPDGHRAMRSAVGARMTQGGRGIGYLVLGSGGPGLYGMADAELLARVGGLIAPRVENYLVSGQMQVLRTHLSTLRNVPAHLGRIAELIATIADAGELTRRIAAEAAAVLPFDRLRFAVRLPGTGTGERVVLLDAGDPRALHELPAEPVHGTALGQVVEGELPAALVARDPESELVVPLRVGGETIGALSARATGVAPYTRADIALAQQLADAVAPYFELRRRAAAVARGESTLGGGGDYEQNSGREREGERTVRGRM